MIERLVVIVGAGRVHPGPATVTAVDTEVVDAESSTRRWPVWVAGSLAAVVTAEQQAAEAVGP